MSKQKKAHYELQENLFNAMSKANDHGLGMIHIFHVALYFVLSEIYKSSPNKKEANHLIESTLKEVQEWILTLI